MEILHKSKPQTERDKFIDRIKLLAQKTKGIAFKLSDDGKYYKVRLFASYIIIRCYKDKLSIHTNGDLGHYEVKELNYSDVRYGTNDLDFIAHLLDDK
jgi:hypothetical protein